MRLLCCLWRLPSSQDFTDFAEILRKLLIFVYSLWSLIIPQEVFFQKTDEQKYQVKVLTTDLSPQPPFPPYCWWKKSCTTWDINWCRISLINSIWRLDVKAELGDVLHRWQPWQPTRVLSWHRDLEFSRWKVEVEGKRLKNIILWKRLKVKRVLQNWCDLKSTKLGQSPKIAKWQLVYK